jgi:hypothetical protein
MEESDQWEKSIINVMLKYIDNNFCHVFMHHEDVYDKIIIYFLQKISKFEEYWLNLMWIKYVW